MSGDILMRPSVLTTSPVATSPGTRSMASASMASASMASVASVAALLPDIGPAAGGAAVSTWFDAATELGPRGYRHLPDASQLTLAAGRRALAGLDPELLALTPTAQRSVWAATSASVSAIHGPMDDVVRDESSDMLSPLRAPYFSVNLVVGRLSNELLAHGGATTFTTPCTGGIDALAGALAAVTRGTSDLALTVACEVPPHPGDPSSADAEAGAVALGLVRGTNPALPTITVRRASWTPQTADADVRDLLDQVGGSSTPLHLLVSAGVELGWLAADETTALVGDGVLAPMVAVADAVLSSRDVVVLVAGPDGRLAAVRVRPALDTQGASS